MPYLICPECDHYYEVEPGEEFEACECGQELIIVEELSEYYDVDRSKRKHLHRKHLHRRNGRRVLL